MKNIGDPSVAVILISGAAGLAFTLKPEGILVGGIIGFTLFELARVYIPWKRVPFLKF